MKTTETVWLVLCLALACCTVRAAQQQYDSGDPTPDEQYVLELINRARANPAAEGKRLGIDINEGLPSGQTATPQPPLAMNKILLGTSRAHSQDMYTRKYFAHTDPDGKDPFQRMDAAGYAGTSEGENIAASSSASAASLEDNLMVDSGTAGRGHRVNLLNTDPSFTYREIGAGYYSGLIPVIGSLQPGVNGLKDFLTQDFGSNATGPFVLGVVFKDANGNNFYDPGEGLAGVTVTPDSGNFFAITGTAGGFAFPVATSGTLTLTATGGALAAPLKMQVTLTGANVKIDFNTSAAIAGTAPMITSPLTADGTQNANFSYTASASGTQPITFTAAGLPPGLTLSGATISGIPTQAGQFMVTLTATNSSGSDTKTLVINLAAAPPPVSNSLTDTDGDGFPDELETALGTSPMDKNDTPFGGAPALPMPLSLTKMQIVLNFLKPASDTLTLSGTLPIPDGLVIAGQKATLDAGGVIRTFTFDAKGKGLAGKDTFMLRIKLTRSAVRAQSAPFTAKISHAAAAALLTDEGLVNADFSGTVSVPVIVLFNQQYLTTTRSLAYKAKRNRSGTAK